MRYVVNFESHDDLLEFARILDNVNRHIDFTYTLNHVVEPSSDESTTDKEYYSVTLVVTPVASRSVTLRHTGNGLVCVTVRKSNGNILLSTITETSEAYKPTEFRERLCGMAAAFSQSMVSKHAYVHTDWAALDYGFKNILPVSVRKQDWAVDLSRSPVACDDTSETNGAFSTCDCCGAEESVQWRTQVGVYCCMACFDEMPFDTRRSGQLLG